MFAIICEKQVLISIKNNLVTTNTTICAYIYKTSNICCRFLAIFTCASGRKSYLSLHLSSFAYRKFDHIPPEVDTEAARKRRRPAQHAAQLVMACVTSHETLILSSFCLYLLLKMIPVFDKSRALLLLPKSRSETGRIGSSFVCLNLIPVNIYYTF